MTPALELENQTTRLSGGQALRLHACGVDPFRPAFSAFFAA